MGCFGEVLEMVKVVFFLVFGDSLYMIGVSLFVDGGIIFVYVIFEWGDYEVILKSINI